MKACKMLPYRRTVAAYEEACGAAEEYGRIWQSASQELLHIQTEQGGCLDRKRTDRQPGETSGRSLYGKKNLQHPGKSSEIQIRQLEEYLRSPELLEKANRLKRFGSEELSQIDKELEDLKLLGATLNDRLQTLQKNCRTERKAARVHYRRNHAQKLL